jgi:hypothetical protein
MRSDGGMQRPYVTTRGEESYPQIYWYKKANLTEDRVELIRSGRLLPAFREVRSSTYVASIGAHVSGPALGPNYPGFQSMMLPRN